MSTDAAHACPKCGYVRKPTDTAPDWQCPRCGIAYAKFGTVPHGHANSLESEPALASEPALGAAMPALGGGGKNIIPLQVQIGHTLLALFLLGYGAYGVAVDEIIVPGKRSTLILHGWSVWVIYAAMICGALVLLSVVVDNYDPRDDERYYHIFAHVFQALGWALFVAAVAAPLFIESKPREILRLEPLAQSGDADAEHQLGVHYHDGTGVARNYGVAMSLFRKSAAQGNLQAMNYLGIMNVHGRGVPVNLEEAERWYRRAADGGLARAQNNLARMYLNAQIRPKDFEQGVQWLQRAAEQGYPYALFNLGRAYEKGTGVEQDWVQAHMWFSLAGAGGDESGARYAKDLESDMKPDEIAQADSLAREWRATHSFAW